MQWRTKIKLDVSPKSISHDDKIISIGSCFAKNIYSCLRTDKFDAYHNPFGTIYNPLSIARTIRSAINLHDLSTDRIVDRNGLIVHYDYHSDLHGPDKEGLLNQYNILNQNLHNQLKKADWLVITLGTAMIYELKSDQIVVTNCHKRPDRLFSRRMLDAPEVENALTRIFSELRDFNPDIRIILTVSPVRHTRDGFTQNSLNKAILRVACAKLSKEQAYTQYFPSFEIMMDDLRDYRFYEADLIHPTDSAIEYIYGLFFEKYFSPSTQMLLKEIRSIHRSIHHVPMNPNSTSHLKFVKSLNRQMMNLQEKYNIDYSKELSNFK